MTRKAITDLTAATYVANGDLFVIETGVGSSPETKSITANLVFQYVVGRSSSISNGTSNVFITGADGNVIISSAGNTSTFDTAGGLSLRGLLLAPVTTKANNSTGTAGQICWDANYIYVCTTTNTWKRAALTTY
jgi:hypothetical protein